MSQKKGVQKSINAGLKRFPGVEAGPFKWSQIATRQEAHEEFEGLSADIDPPAALWATKTIEEAKANGVKPPPHGGFVPETSRNARIRLGRSRRQNRRLSKPAARPTKGYDGYAQASTRPSMMPKQSWLPGTPFSAVCMKISGRVGMNGPSVRSQIILTNAIMAGRAVPFLGGVSGSLWRKEEPTEKVARRASA